MINTKAITEAGIKFFFVLSPKENRRNCGVRHSQRPVIALSGNKIGQRTLTDVSSLNDTSRKEVCQAP